MKAIKLTEEQKEKMSYTDVAHLILTEKGKKMKIQDLFKGVIKLLGLPESYFESKIADFFGLLSTDKRFTMIEKGYWDLKDNHSSKVILDEEEDDEEEEIIETEEEIVDEAEEGNEDDEINYDDDSIDDDEEEDDLKDLVIMDESEELEM